VQTPQRWQLPLGRGRGGRGGKPSSPRGARHTAASFQTQRAGPRGRSRAQGKGSRTRSRAARAPRRSSAGWQTAGTSLKKQTTPKNQTFLAPSSSSPLFLLLLLSFPGWGGSEQRRSPQNTPPRSTPARSTMIKPPSLRQGTKQVL